MNNYERMNERVQSQEAPVAGSVFEVNTNGDFLIIELDAISEAYPNDDLLADLKRLMDYLEDESTAKLILFRSREDRGAIGNIKPDSDYFRRSEKVLAQLSRLPMPTVFMLENNCSAFLFQFALSCDFRVGTENSSFSCPEIKDGYLPGIVTFYLSKYVGLGVARKMILGGIPLNSEDAFKHGLLDVISTSENMETDLHDFISTIVPNDTSAFKMGRRLINESFMNSYETALGKLLAVQNKCLK